MKTIDNLSDPIKEISEEFFIADKGLVGTKDDEKQIQKKLVGTTKKDQQKRIDKAITNIRVAAIYALPIVGLILFFYIVRFYYFHASDEQKLNHLLIFCQFLKDNGIPTVFGALLVSLFKGK